MSVADTKGRRYPPAPDSSLSSNSPKLAAFAAGVDEAGRGPLAGPVMAAAVVLDPATPIRGLNDSKKLSAARRDELFDTVRRSALAWALGRAEVEEIDRINILKATMLAMQRAVQALSTQPGLVYVDGNRRPQLDCPGIAVVGGDALVPQIAAASILAKVARDRVMQNLDAVYPGYGFCTHKGYPTAAHVQALQRLGPSPEHRHSFAPVRRVLQGQADAKAFNHTD